MSIARRIAVFIIVGTSIEGLQAAPAKNISQNTISNDPASSYDLNQFEAIYDQRQNGSENYRVNLDGIVVVLAPPAGLLQAASLLDPALFGEDYSDLDEFFLVNNEHSSSTTSTTTTRPTSSPAAVTSETTEKIEITPSQQAAIGSRRKIRIPGFIRPFVTRRRSNS